MLRDDIGEIIEYASRFFITTIYDNGSMAIEKIDDLRKADFVAISLDTLDEKKFDYIKGVKGAWKKAMEAVEKLKEEGVRVGVSPTISQLNLYEIPDLTRYFTSQGIPVWYCLYWYDYPSEERLFGIGKKVDEFEITDKGSMVKLCDELIKMKKDNPGIFITTKTLKALKKFFMNGERTWKCQALKSFFMIDHKGRVAGCHLREPVATIFELPKVWNSKRFEKLRQIYSKCTRCAYLCYIFYSLHGGVFSNMELIPDGWRSILMLAKDKVGYPCRSLF